MNTTTTKATATKVLETTIEELMAEAEVILKNLNQNPDLHPDRINAMDRIGRLSGAAKKLQTAARIIVEANRIMSTISY